MGGDGGDGTQLRITYLQNPQVEIIYQKEVVGEGIKKTLAYDTPMTKSELEKWRSDFWGKFTAAAI
jgi:hypothetical protein